MFVVKSALSGDTVLLEPVGKPSDETQLSMAFVTAPRLNEPFGFEAREYLRTLLVGKKVQATISYEINGRNYGDLVAPVFKSLVIKGLEDGNWKLRDDSDTKPGFDAKSADAYAAQDKARSSETRIWQDQLPPAPVPAGSLPESQAVTAIVERVIAGDRYQVRALVTPASHFTGQVLLAGVRAPRSSSDDNSDPAKQSSGEPYGDAAKKFVSTRLLQRSVQLILKGSSSTGLPVVEVAHPAGDIATLILSNGLGTVSDWQSTILGPSRMATLRESEKKAKLARLNIWTDYQSTNKLAASLASATIGGSQQPKSFEAVVTKVISSDTLEVQSEDGVSRTVQLASLRGARKSDPKTGPFLSEAKEFARKRFIGKRLLIKVEATRPQTGQYEERQIVSALRNGKNDIALEIVSKGYASVIRHKRGDDSDRSPIWDELVQQESEAIAAQRGFHSKKIPHPERVVDASENLTRAKGFESSLTRKSAINGVVDHVFSASRFRIQAPRENLTLTLVLSGIRAPRGEEPLASDAHAFVSKQTYQRDVTFSVVSVDRTGAFIGNLFLSTDQNNPLSVSLVKEGFAEVHEYSAELSGYSNALFDAQEKAQLALKGIWRIKEDERLRQEAASVPAQQIASANVDVPRYQDAYVTSLSPSGSIYYRLRSESAPYDAMTAQLRTHFASAQSQNPLRSAKKGEHVVVLAPDGKSYQRAKVLFHEYGTYTLLLVDSGKTVTASLNKLRSAPSECFAKYPFFARKAELSFLSPPPSSPTDYLSEYVARLKEILLDKQVAIKIDHKSTDQDYVTIYTADSRSTKDSINHELVADGYALVKRDSVTWESNQEHGEFVSSLRDQESAARSAHYGVWEYGDPLGD